MSEPTPAPTRPVAEIAPAAGIPLVDILGARIHNLTKQELLQRLTHGVLVTPNVDIIMRLRKDAEFRDVFERAEFRVCDSRIVQIGSRFLGTPFKEKISGSDFFPAYCEHHRANPDIRVFLLGAGPGVADEAMRRINARSGRDIVVGAHSPSFGFEKNQAENAQILQRVNDSGATVLAVGLGAPKQEKWIARHRAQLPGIAVFMGIGATLDFEAGNVRRSPPWMSSMGIEWLYRLIQEPRRLWRRYLVDDLPFFWLLLKQRLGLLAPPSR